ncbi:hypothetical protein LX32DRAFT_639983 [Colletotrichum zoysiae]|uniref:Uncharacterized protein n=1 Tax=Colletotrichum zoysiae TaxID=1216348 RepID=A0AAD9HG76_9PEZI|nr:hypothetical protein LX32DRAFT_639983 [Colletotrichum zoysiae]
MQRPINSAPLDWPFLLSTYLPTYLLNPRLSTPSLFSWALSLLVRLHFHAGPGSACGPAPPSPPPSRMSSLLDQRQFCTLALTAPFSNPLSASLRIGPETAHTHTHTRTTHTAQPRTAPATGNVLLDLYIDPVALFARSAIFCLDRCRSSSSPAGHRLLPVF